MELPLDNKPLIQNGDNVVKKKKNKPQETAELKDYESYFSMTYFLEVFKEVTYKSIPRLLTYEFNLLTMALINIYLLGQKGNLIDIKIFGLGDVWARIFAYSLIKYKNMTLQQECTIALSAKNYPYVGIYYQRSLFIVGLICILSAPFLCFWWKALLFFNIEKTIATKAGDYMWVCLPSIFCYSYYDTTNNYLQSQNVLWPQIGIQFLQVILHYFVSHTMIIDHDMGVLGAAWAKNFSDAVSAGLIYAFISLKNPTPKTWIEWDSRAFNGIQKYLQQSIRNGIGSYLEEVAFLFLTMMSMYLSDPANTATHIALQNSGLFHFSFFLGLHFVINNYINHSISKGFIDRAKRRTFMCIITSFIYIGIALFVLLNNKTQWSELFSTNNVVQLNLQSSIKIYAKIVALDGLQLTFCAILKALDRFNHITIIYSVSYYLIGISTSLYQGFYLGKGEIGIWTGWLASAAVSSIAFFFVFIFTTWYNQYKSIKERYNKNIIISNFQKRN